VTTKASCAYTRPFIVEGMDVLKFTDTIEYKAGFNFWSDSESKIIIAADVSVMQTWIILEDADATVFYKTLTAFSAGCLFVFSMF